jgi:uncharacterized protein YkwD
MRGRIFVVAAPALSFLLAAPIASSAALRTAVPMAASMSVRSVVRMQASVDVTPIENRFVELINGERAKAGLGPLAIVPELVTIGRAWSGAMRTSSGGGDPCVISHNPSFSAQVTANWRRLGENVGCGPVEAEFLHQKFVESPPHFKNIMDPTFDSVGIGIVVDGDTMFVTQQFMDLRDATPTSASPAILALDAKTVVVAKLKGAKTKRKVVVKK